MQHGAKPTEATLHTAIGTIWYSKGPVVQEILNHGVKPTQENLENAVGHLAVESAVVLMEHGVKPTDDMLRYAQFAATTELAEALIKYGAKPTQAMLDDLIQSDPAINLALLFKTEIDKADPKSSRKRTHGPKPPGA